MTDSDSGDAGRASYSIARAIEDAGWLVAHAARRGIELDAGDLDTLIGSADILKQTPPDPARLRAFWKSLQKAAAKIQPASLDSWRRVDADEPQPPGFWRQVWRGMKFWRKTPIDEPIVTSFAKTLVTRFRRRTLVSLFSLLLFQIYWIVGWSVTTEIAESRKAWVILTNSARSPNQTPANGASGAINGTSGPRQNGSKGTKDAPILAEGESLWLIEYRLRADFEILRTWSDVWRHPVSSLGSMLRHGLVTHGQEQPGANTAGSLADAQPSPIHSSATQAAPTDQPSQPTASSETGTVQTPPPRTTPPQTDQAQPATSSGSLTRPAPPPLCSSSGAPLSPGADVKAVLECGQHPYEAATIVLKSLSSYLLPLLYGLLGALVYTLRAIEREIREITLRRISGASYGLRITLGALAGLAIGWFLNPTGSEFVSLTTTETANAGGSALPVGSIGWGPLAFLAGYSVDLLFALMDRILLVFGGSSPTAGTAKS